MGKGSSSNVDGKRWADERRLANSNRPVASAHPASNRAPSAPARATSASGARPPLNHGLHMQGTLLASKQLSDRRNSEGGHATTQTHTQRSMVDVRSIVPLQFGAVEAVCETLGSVVQSSAAGQTFPEAQRPSAVQPAAVEQYTSLEEYAALEQHASAIQASDAMQHPAATQHVSTHTFAGQQLPSVQHGAPRGSISFDRWGARYRPGETG